MFESVGFSNYQLAKCLVHDMHKIGPSVDGLFRATLISRVVKPKGVPVRCCDRREPARCLCGLQ